ncbi:MAG: TIGR02301 family protein [Pseudomonadota bacterium]
MPRTFLSFALAFLLAFSASGAAFAQEGEEAKPDTPRIRVLPPAYDAQMMRLSEILGALHYLRELCGAEEGQLWRDQMSQLIEKEEPTEARRARMIARFNQGFRGFQETYRDCTPAALEANKRYVEEGGTIAAEIPSRYGR